MALSKSTPRQRKREPASGCTSGSGLDSAKTIAPGAIAAMAGSATELLDRPMNTSAPASADSVEPVRFARFVCSARGRLDRVQAVPAAVDQALAVRGRDVADPGPEQHLRHRDTGCAGPGHHGAKLAELLAGHPGRAAQRGQ